MTVTESGVDPDTDPLPVFAPAHDHVVIVEVKILHRSGAVVDLSYPSVVIAFPGDPAKAIVCLYGTSAGGTTCNTRAGGVIPLLEPGDKVRILAGAAVDVAGNESDEATETVTAVNLKAGPPADFAVVPGDRQVVLTWTAPADPYPPDAQVAVYQYRRRPAAGPADDWTDWTAIADRGVETATIDVLPNDVEQVFQLRAVTFVSGFGISDLISGEPTSEVRATPGAPNTAPAIGAPANFFRDGWLGTFEDSTGQVAQFTADDAEDNQVTWSLSGDDKDAFTIADNDADNGAMLSLAAALDY
ncbi:MAG TPA: hypothetical protein DEP66_05875, partial [Acidimicrobiaceae bacterium]|nr:hypothetical protein [Acidimicrobiaceae bacterium]